MTWSNRVYSLKYLRSTTLGCKDRGIKISEFVGKTQFLSPDVIIQEVFWAETFFYIFLEHGRNMYEIWHLKKF